MTFDASDIRKIAADLSNAGPQALHKSGMILRKTAFDIVAAAKNRAPVDTGNLKGSIGADFPTPLSADIGPAAEYGKWVEFGTSRMAPQPFMGPAADIHLPKFEEAIVQMGGEILDG